MTTIYKVTLILLAACAGSLIARRGSVATRHAIWTASLISAGILPLVSMLVPRWRPPAAGFLIAADAVDGSIRSHGGYAWLTILWAAGAIVALIPWLRSMHAVSRISQSGRPTGHVGTVPVLETVTGMTPMVAGLFRPRILLPAASAAWSPKLRSNVLAHELAHVERRDCLWFTLGRLIAAAYWFHPLVWLALREMRREAESACDDHVLRSGVSPADYAEDLILIAKSNLGAPLTAAPMTGSSPLETRMRTILRSTTKRGPANFIWVALIALVVIAPLAALQQEPYDGADESITKPQLISRVNPAYTPEARAARIQGTVSTSVVIGSSGHVDKITLIKGVDPGLDANAVAAIQQWTFEPGRKDGQPVAVQVKIDVTFRLK